jgi:hypothetical protein
MASGQGKPCQRNQRCTSVHFFLLIAGYDKLEFTPSHHKRGDAIDNISDTVSSALGFIPAAGGKLLRILIQWVFQKLHPS